MAALIDKAYVMKWVGPFCSIDQLKNWEEDNLHFIGSIYLIGGFKPKGKRKKFYCGKTKKTRFVFERLSDAGHHIKELAKTDLEIWIGMMTNCKPTDANVFEVENIITSAMANLEIPEKDMLNQINMHTPKMDAYVINRWFKPGDVLIERGSLKADSVAYRVPDLIIYDATTENYKGTKRLKRTLY